MTAIDTTDLTKRYATTLAVDALSLTIPDGTVYGLSHQLRLFPKLRRGKHLWKLCWLNKPLLSV